MGDRVAEDSRRWVMPVIGAVAVLAAMVAVTVAAGLWRRRAPPLNPSAYGGPTTTLLVGAFRTIEPAPRAVGSGAFADSLVARLSRMPGLTVRAEDAGGGIRTEFALHGDVSSRDGRLAIAARLFHAPATEAVWTATFWRADSLTSDLISDLAGAVAEAVYGQLAKSAVMSKGEIP